MRTKYTVSFSSKSSSSEESRLHRSTFLLSRSGVLPPSGCTGVEIITHSPGLSLATDACLEVFQLFLIASITRNVLNAIKRVSGMLQIFLSLCASLRNALEVLLSGDQL